MFAWISARSCSVGLSKLARNIVTQDILPLLSEFDMPSKCFLNGDLDMSRPLEEAKRARKRVWQCGICQKQFLAEGYLETHLETFHSDHMPSNATVCLGDYCDILGCERSDKVLRECSASAFRKRKIECESILNVCFPAGNAATHPLNAKFSEKYCSRDPCSGGLVQPLKATESYSGEFHRW